MHRIPEAETFRLYLRYTESKFLKNLARGQEGGPQAKLPGAYCGIFKDRFHPRLRAYLAPAPTPFHSKVDPRMKLRTESRTKC